MDSFVNTSPSQDHWKASLTKRSNGSKISWTTDHEKGLFYNTEPSILSTQTTCCTTDLNSRRFLMEIFARRARTCGKLVARAMAAVAILALIGGFSPTPPPNTCCITPTFRIFVPSICPFQCTNVRVEIVMHDGIRHRYYTVNGTYSVPSGGSGLSDISGAFCFKGRWEMYANVTCNGRVYRYNLVALWKCPTKTSGTESFIVPFTLKCPS